MPGRSQRHMQEYRHHDSHGAVPSGPAITALNPSAASIAAAGAIARTVATMTAVGGTAPITWSISSNPDGIAVSFLSNLLRSTADPIGSTGAHTVNVRGSDDKGRSLVEALVVTLT